MQFQPGPSMREFLRQFGTDAQCVAALEAARRPRGFVCPGCRGSARTSFARGSLRYWQCGGCGHQCSLLGGATLEATKRSLGVWFLAMQLLTKAKNSVPALELIRQSGVSYRSAWLMSVSAEPKRVVMVGRRASVQVAKLFAVNTLFSLC